MNETGCPEQTPCEMPCQSGRPRIRTTSGATGAGLCAWTPDVKIPSRSCRPARGPLLGMLRIGRVPTRRVVVAGARKRRHREAFFNRFGLEGLALPPLPSSRRRHAPSSGCLIEPLGQPRAPTAYPLLLGVTPAALRSRYCPASSYIFSVASVRRDGSTPASWCACPSGSDQVTPVPSLIARTTRPHGLKTAPTRPSCRSSRSRWPRPLTSACLNTNGDS